MNSSVKISRCKAFEETID